MQSQILGFPTDLQWHATESLSEFEIQRSILTCSIALLSDPVHVQFSEGLSIFDSSDGIKAMSLLPLDRTEIVSSG
jgi:hypothetical protein